MAPRKAVAGDALAPADLATARPKRAGRNRLMGNAYTAEQ